MRSYLTAVLFPLFALFSLMSISVAHAGDRGAERVRAVLQTRFPDAQIGMPLPSTIPGYYEVNLGSQVLYVSGNGRYLIVGDLIDLQQDENVSEARRAALRRQLLDQLDPNDMIVLGAKRPSRVITVFSNIHCQYCRNEHQELKKLLSRGDVQVRYVLLPDGRKDSTSYAETEAVWCAADRSRALEAAFAGQALPLRKCSSDLRRYLITARKLNLQGLPSMVLDNGSMASGFVTASQIQQWLASTPAP